MTLAWIIGKNTYKEVIRDRVLYGLLFFAVILIFIGLLLGELTFAEQARIVTDLGLVAAQLGCAMLATFVGSSLVWREIEKQTVLTILSKPVSRGAFLIGKFSGLVMVLFLVNLLVSGFLALICLYFGQVHWPQFVTCQAGVLLESTFLLAVAIFFGVFCRPILTTMFTFSVWLIGHGINDLSFFSDKSKNPALKALGTGISKVFPNLSVFDFKEAVIYGDPISVSQLLQAFGLWAAWLVILLVLSTWIFENRDFI